GAPARPWRRRQPLASAGAGRSAELSSARGRRGRRGCGCTGRQRQRLRRRLALGCTLGIALRHCFTMFLRLTLPLVVFGRVPGLVLRRLVAGLRRSRRRRRRCGRSGRRRAARHVRTRLFLATPGGVGLAPLDVVAAHLVPDLVHALRRPLLALLLVQHFLLQTQLFERAAAVAPGFIDARGDHETGAAVSLALRIGGLCLGPLGLDAISLGLFFRGVERERTRQHHRGGDEQQQAQDLHVSEVSTSRRPKARNSADCISANRDTVRGNWCVSCPFAYSSSGGTSADMISFTRRSYITSTSQVKRLASDAWRGVICGTLDTSTVWNCVASSR